MSDRTPKRPDKVTYLPSADGLTYDIIVDIYEPSFEVSPETRAMLDRQKRARREAREHAAGTAPPPAGDSTADNPAQ